MVLNSTLSQLRMFAVMVLVPLVGAVLPVPVVEGAPIATASRSTSPQSLVLHARDLPAAFGGGFRETGTSISNVEVAAIEHVTASTIDRHGRLGGYESVFTQQKGKSTFLISDSVGAYRTASDAHWQYSKFLSVSRVPPGSAMMSMRGIGNEARAYVLSNVFGAQRVTIVGVYFRRGAFDARIDISHIGSLRTADMQALTRVLDGRLRRAQ